MVLFESYIPKSGTIEVPPEGSLEAPIALVGEAPGKNEVAQRRPFVGKSGDLLNHLLEQSGIKREDCYITNLFKFEIRKAKVRSGSRVVDAYFRGKTKLWQYDLGFTTEGLKYKKELIDELKSFKGNVIVPLGNASMFAILGLTHITKRRGSVLWSSTLGKKVIPVIHPAATFRNYLDRILIKYDLGKVAREMTSASYNPPNPILHISPTFTEAKQFLSRCLSSKMVAFDIEVLRGEMSCISFAISPNEAMSIPFVTKGENFFTIEQEIELTELITQIIQSKEITKIAQNIAFDATFLFSHYGMILSLPYEDTMIAHKTLYPEFPMGLDIITSTYTDFPYYKDEGKEQLKAPHDWDTYWRYNAKDSLMCMIAWPKMKADLELMGNLDAYEHQKRLVLPCIYMGQRGIRVDKERLDKLSEKAETEMEIILNELETLTGRRINPNSSDQCKEYFYKEKKVKPYVKKGKAVMDESALVRIKRKGFKEADLILRYRKLSTMKSRYYTMKLKEHSDGTFRLHTFFKPVTAMARLASSKDLDGYGFNEQNQPKSMNVAFRADEGKLIFNVDLSQADARTVAYVGNVKEMIHAFETGEDIHSKTASGLFGIPADEIKRMDKEGVKAPIGHGDKTHRKWGKECNHSLNFGVGYKTFSFRLEIPETQGKELIEKYHSLYPEVRGGYHRVIQEQLSRNRTVRNCFGRVFLFLDRWGDELFKKGYAAVAQSNTAEVINRWGLIPSYYDPKFRDVDLLRQVHDSINFQLPLSLGVERIADLLIEMKKSLERELRWEDRLFVIPSDWSAGFDLGNQTDLIFDSREHLIEQLKEIIKNEH